MGGRPEGLSLEGLAGAAPGLRCAKVGEPSSVTLVTTEEPQLYAARGRAGPFCFGAVR